MPTCARCQAVVPDGTRFCGACGAPVSNQAGETTVGDSGLSSRTNEQDYRTRLAEALGTGYQLRELIGQGGFGAVYAARDTTLDRDVAVKAIRHDLLSTPDLRQRFEREAKAVAKLRHPHILPIYSIGESGDIAFMVMPLVEGESLDALLTREKKLPLDQAVRIASEVASALEEAHRHGLIHRDVKPANILIDGPERRAMLMDFGIVKAATASDEAITGTGVIIGSPAYMSPEQTRGDKDIDGRADVYSLGAVSYEMLAGRRPFQAASLHELVFKQVTNQIEDLAVIAPAVPDNIGHAVMRSLAMDRDNRWQTAADFRRQLADSQRPRQQEADPIAESESWLSVRGPYIMLLVFARFFLDFLNGTLETSLTPEYVNELETAWMLRFGINTTTILLIVAALDAAVRVLYRGFRGHTFQQVSRFLLGQPAWWQTWYPRSLRVPDSVWDRLPLRLRILRSLVWLILLVGPAGGVLVVFAFPTFQQWTAAVGLTVPRWMDVSTYVVMAAGWAFYPTLGWLAVEFRILVKKYNLRERDILGSLFNLRGRYWQASPVRVVLE